VKIHRSACEYARNDYNEKYGVDYHADPEYTAGNERHQFWIHAYSARQESLIVNRYQD
jgi:hypothetical protein